GFIRREFVSTFVQIDPQNLTSTDYKTSLQERLQSFGLPTPHYAIVESLGPDHRRVFQVELRVNSYCLATGEGTTIKGAHQAAARAALDNLETELDRLRENLAVVEPPPSEPVQVESEFEEAPTEPVPVEPEFEEAPNETTA
ncbi:MAG: putative dsRNA-binding protein, partial [Acidobacteria bacterium]|nr:putative dsRNA-binding protein [Acidobacteriota bacterium]